MYIQLIFSRTASISRVLAILLLSLLASCSSKQVVNTPTNTQLIEEISTEPSKLSAQQHVELAKTIEPDQALINLLTATKLFYQEENFIKALWLADKVIPMVDDKTPNHTQENMLLSLIKASSLQQLGYFPESQQELKKLELYAQLHDIQLSVTYYRLLHALYQKTQRPVAAISAQLHAFELTKPASKNEELITSISHEFINLSQWQLSLLAKENPPNSAGWIKLTSIANKFGGNQEQTNYHVGIWKKKYKHHPANVIADHLMAQNITQKVIKNIAVILPLSGKQKAAGIVIQQGVMASFANNPDKKLHFIDSNELNWHGLTNELSILEIDYVIGPLLKSNVDKYVSHTSLEYHSNNNYMLDANSSLFDLNKKDTSDNEPETTANTNYFSSSDYLKAVDSDDAINNYLNPEAHTQVIDTLLLNIPTKKALTNHQTVLSMRPEDEARQAASTLSRKDFKHPIVLSQQSAISKRIAQAFVTQWKRVTGKEIDIVYYDTGSQMQDNITSSLGVDKSKLRINTLKRRLNKSIKTQTRNRRDIDMIYLVGNPEQTRLVKPYIEVNISPFADIIPVYASSRSHSSTIDYSSNSDLQGLSFTEIPWLLTEKQDAELAALSKDLWPKRSDGLSRLFAMGFDSYQLINKIPLMQQAPYLQHWGQTGVLNLGENNILTRSLFWGEYKRNKVVSVVME